VTPDERLAELQARVAELSALVASAQARLGTDADLERDRRRLSEQARRVGDAARYFLIGP
jgi:hypothetical protein